MGRFGSSLVPLVMQDSYFDDSATIRRVNRELIVAFAGPRALLMMAAHPVAFEGFFMSTGALDDPYARLRRTAIVIDEIVWGSREKADGYCAMVRKAHATVKGTIPEAAGRFPAGTPYGADDPELLLWILACLVDAADLGYRRYVGSLTRDERDELWQDYKVVGRLFGIPDAAMPADIEGFDAYMHGVLNDGTLWVTERAREVGRDVVFHPPAPVVARPLVEVVNQMTVGLLPPRIRKGYGLSWDPARTLALRSQQEYVRRVLLPLLPDKLRLTRSARGQGVHLTASKADRDAAGAAHLSQAA